MIMTSILSGLSRDHQIQREAAPEGAPLAEPGAGGEPRHLAARGVLGLVSGLAGPIPRPMPSVRPTPMAEPDGAAFLPFCPMPATRLYGRAKPKGLPRRSPKGDKTGCPLYPCINGRPFGKATQTGHPGRRQSMLAGTTLAVRRPSARVAAEPHHHRSPTWRRPSPDRSARRQPNRATIPRDGVSRTPHDRRTPRHPHHSHFSNENKLRPGPGRATIYPRGACRAHRGGRAPGHPRTNTGRGRPGGGQGPSRARGDTARLLAGGFTAGASPVGASRLADSFALTYLRAIPPHRCRRRFELDHLR
ncbi:hypothetical protein FB559_5994 [Actinoallomurus bryophytorum]|uniref:Uncharacterized protein n=1 Tax=Actinoallomurus bryophytorum TaxID=1490222 RepID=A0A543CT48_9ACTN|nr:hypothetical protein FB559_5994 [Actinoallomurus bryophytorum]